MELDNETTEKNIKKIKREDRLKDFNEQSTSVLMGPAFASSGETEGFEGEREAFSGLEYAVGYFSFMFSQFRSGGNAEKIDELKVEIENHDKKK